jgi:ERCC4-type nuclease
VTLLPNRLDVDFSERHAAVLNLACQCGCFDVRLVRLAAGDYLIDNAVLVERKA